MRYYVDVDCSVCKIERNKDRGGKKREQSLCKKC